MAEEMRVYLAGHPRLTEPQAPLFARRRVGGAWDPKVQKADPFNWAKPIDTANLRRRVFHPACDAVLGRHIRLHDSRHTAGSLWIAAGWNLFDVSRTLGHSSVDFSMRTYAKQLGSSGQRNADLMAAYKRSREV